MSLFDWLLFLHVLSAFALVGALTAFWTLALAPISDAATARFSRPTTVLIGVGLVGTIVFGVWLAIDVDGYELWDGWILAALVLWAVGAWLGSRTGKAFARATGDTPEAADARRQGLLLHGGNSLVVLIILALMIWKPGA